MKKNDTKNNKIKKAVLIVSILLAVLFAAGGTTAVIISKTHSHKHLYTETVIDPTCLTGGYTLHKCECGHEYKDNYTDPLGHDFTKWNTEKEATCLDIGIEKHICKRCGYTEVRDITALGHDMGEWYCSSSTACIAGGTERRDCSRCSYYEERDINALGHIPSEWIPVKEASCLNDGIEHIICKRCGEELDKRIIPALGHSPSDWITVFDPTCVDPGREHIICTRCNKELDSRETAPLGHNLGGWGITKNPSCTESGLKERTCSRCEYKESQTIDKLGHDWTEWHTVKEPTRSSDGLKQRECRRCGKTETQIIPKLSEYISLPDTPYIFEYKSDENVAVLTGIKDKAYTAMANSLYVAHGTDFTVPSHVYLNLNGEGSGWDCSVTDYEQKKSENPDACPNYSKLSVAVHPDAFKSNAGIRKISFEDEVAFRGKTGNYQGPYWLDYLFVDCTALQSVNNLPDNVYSMVGTFSGCSSLLCLDHIPADVEDIRELFWKCSSLEVAPNIPNQITNMSKTFGYCESLKKVPDLPEKIQDLNQTFIGCSSIKIIPTIPETVKELTYAFAHCKSLNGLFEIRAELSGDMINKAFFNACDSNGVFHIILVGSNKTFNNEFPHYAQGSPMNHSHTEGFTLSDWDGCWTLDEKTKTIYLDGIRYIQILSTSSPLSPDASGRFYTIDIPAAVSLEDTETEDTGIKDVNGNTVKGKKVILGDDYRVVVTTYALDYSLYYQLSRTINTYSYYIGATFKQIHRFDCVYAQEGTTIQIDPYTVEKTEDGYLPYFFGKRTYSPLSNGGIRFNRLRVSIESDLGQDVGLNMDVFKEMIDYLRDPSTINLNVNLNIILTPTFTDSDKSDFYIDGDTLYIKPSSEMIMDLIRYYFPQT